MKGQAFQKSSIPSMIVAVQPVADEALPDGDASAVGVASLDRVVAGPISSAHSANDSPLPTDCASDASESTTSDALGFSGTTTTLRARQNASTGASGSSGRLLVVGPEGRGRER